MDISFSILSPQRLHMCHRILETYSADVESFGATVCIDRKFVPVLLFNPKWVKETQPINHGNVTFRSS